MTNVGISMLNVTSYYAEPLPLWCKLTQKLYDDDDKHEKISKWLGISVTGMTLCVNTQNPADKGSKYIDDDLKLTKTL